MDLFRLPDAKLGAKHQQNSFTDTETITSSSRSVEFSMYCSFDWIASMESFSFFCVCGIQSDSAFNAFPISFFILVAFTKL